MLSDILKQSLPRYETKIPSTQKSVKFRPFLVRDEKTLLVSMETSSKKDLIVTFANLIQGCVDEDISIQDLFMVDLEHMLIQLRSKSIGDTVEFSVIDERGKEIEIEIDLSKDLTITGDYEDTEFDLGNNVACKFRHPRVKDFLYEELEETSPEDFMKIMAKCLVEITTKEETINTETYSDDEKIDFIESMNKEQFEKVLEHFAKTPKITAKKTYRQDNEEKTIVFEGLKDFFV